MRVGVYIDAFNLYYGMRDHCGRGTAGWRWLDIRGLTNNLAGWGGSTVTRIVYCTAYVDPADNQDAHRDQALYIKALREHQSIDVLQLGRYVAWPKNLPLARKLANGGAEVVRPTGAESWQNLPISQVSDPHGGIFMATVRTREEKGSDVNVATHLLADVFRGEVDAAIVVSNDSDLALPLAVARSVVSVGTVNPGIKQLAGALKGDREEGPGRHWWRKLSPQDYRQHQLPNPVGRYYKPAGW